METSDIDQKVIFQASPHEVYELIMDADKHATFAGGEVTMSREIGGTFNIFDGYCSGHNIELKQDEKIVQAWNFREDGWPEDHFSTCTFEFEQKGDSTELKFVQTGIPAHKRDALAEGWKTYYWEPMTDMLRK